MGRNKRSEDCQGPSCDTCLRYISQAGCEPKGCGIAWMQRYCMRTKADVNPKRHHGCNFHSDVCPLTEEETAERDRVLKAIEERTKRLERLRSSVPPRRPSRKTAAALAVAAVMREFGNPW